MYKSIFKNKIVSSSKRGRLLEWSFNWFWWLNVCNQSLIAAPYWWGSQRPPSNQWTLSGWATLPNHCTIQTIRPHDMRILLIIWPPTKCPHISLALIRKSSLGMCGISLENTLTYLSIVLIKLSVGVFPTMRWKP